MFIDSKKIFEQVSGFDEEKLKVAFNDIDLCLKVKQLGYFNLWTPNAMLYHHESASRGSDLAPEKRKRFNKEANFIKDKWSGWISNDPNYNLNLTRNHEDFSLGHQ